MIQRFHQLSMRRKAMVVAVVLLAGCGVVGRGISGNCTVWLDSQMSLAVGGEDAECYSEDNERACRRAGARLGLMPALWGDGLITQR